tara:strand:+ start:3262 stop:3372 length:111 start_codon:yes stop_codon:yes gene_type:complete
MKIEKSNEGSSYNELNITTLKEGYDIQKYKELVIKK